MMTTTTMMMTMMMKMMMMMMTTMMMTTMMMMMIDCLKLALKFDDDGSTAERPHWNAFDDVVVDDVEDDLSGSQRCQMKPIWYVPITS